MKGKCWGVPSDSLLMLFFCVISCAEDGGAIQQALSKYIGRSTVPQVFINGEHIGGSDGKHVHAILVALSSQ